MILRCDVKKEQMKSEGIPQEKINIWMKEGGGEHTRDSPRSPQP